MALLVALQRRQVDARLARVDQVQLVVATHVVALALGVRDAVAVEIADLDTGALQIVDIADDAVDQGAQEERTAPAGVDVLGFDESRRLVGTGTGPELGAPWRGRVSGGEREEVDHVVALEQPVVDGALTLDVPVLRDAGEHVAVLALEVRV